MRKSIISLVGLTALLALTGCTPESGSKKAMVAPTSFGLTSDACSLVVGQTYEVKADYIRPFEAYDAQFKYTTSNKAVAKVDSKGVITAVGPGECTVRIASKLNPEVFIDYPVYVAAKITSSNAKKYAKTLKASQTAHEAEAKKLICNQHVVVNKTANGEDYKYNDFTQTYTADQPNGYFNIDIYDETKYTTGGSNEFTDMGYYFMTNAGYDSWIYHYDGDDVHNKFYLKTEDFIDKGYSRFEVVKMMLDSIFSSGREMITRRIDAALDQDLLDDIIGESDSSASAFSFGNKSSVTINAAGLNEATGDFVVKTGSSGTYVIGNDQESDWGIPAGTSFTYKEEIVTHWRGDYVVNEDIYIKLVYTVNKIKYVEEEFITYSFKVNDEVSYTRPVPTDYETVWSLSDL